MKGPVRGGGGGKAPGVYPEPLFAGVRTERLNHGGAYLN